MATDQLRRRSAQGASIPSAPANLDPSTFIQGRPMGSPEPAAPAAPAMPSTLRQLGSAIAETPSDLRRAGRDFVADPVGETQKALAPLPGLGGAASRLGAVLPTINAGRTALSAGGLASAAGLTMAQNERDALMNRVPESGYSGGSGPRTRYRSTSGITQAPPGTENTYTGGNGVTRRVKGGAPAPEAGFERLTALGGNDAERIQLRGRQGGIIKNPDAMSTMDRLRMIGTDSAFKGSPSLRRLAAQGVLDEAGREDANYQAALSEQAQQDYDQQRLQSGTREAFANRRLVADRANQGAGEDRRENDRSYELAQGEQMLGAAKLANEMDVSARQRVSDRYDRIAAEYQQANPGTTYEQAAQHAASVAASEGADTGATPITRGADSNSAFMLEQGMKAGDGGSNPFSRFRRWIDNSVRGFEDGAGATEGGFDPSNYEASEQGILGRLQSYVPGGIDPDDVVLTDRATGRQRAAPRSSLGGLDPELFNRRGYERRTNRGE